MPSKGDLAGPFGLTVDWAGTTFSELHIHLEVP